MPKSYRIIIFWAILLVVFFGLMSFISSRHRIRRCPEVRISVNQMGGVDFISATDVRKFILSSGDSLIGQPMGRINIFQLEQLLGENPYIASTQVYASVDGIVNIDVVQRRPIVRVQSNRDEAFYISTDGKLMPLNPGRPARVLFANGVFNYNINKEEVRQMNLRLTEVRNAEDSALVISPLYKIYKIASFIDQDSFLRSQITQIYLDAEGEITLIPLVGGHIILFGDIANPEEKFNKLIAFYKNALPVEGWETYDTINLKYKNQVVCSFKQI